MERSVKMWFSRCTCGQSQVHFSVTEGLARLECVSTSHTPTVYFTNGDGYVRWRIEGKETVQMMLRGEWSVVPLFLGEFIKRYVCMNLHANVIALKCVIDSNLSIRHGKIIANHIQRIHPSLSV